MTARATMGTLITFTRNLIGDTSGTATQKFSDDNVQDALDARRQIIRAARMGYTPTPTATGYQFKDYQSARFYEGSATITNVTYGTVTPDVVDYANGVYQFNTSQLPDLYISGNRYDVYAAAAELCDRWAASLFDAIDFSADRTSFKQSQKVDNLRKRAQELRRQSESSGPRSIPLYRSDTDYVEEWE